MGGSRAGLLTTSRPLLWQKLRYSSALLGAHPATLCILGITLLAGAIRVYDLTSKDIWYDEAFIITLAQMPIPEMYRNLITLDPHPPLYYLFMHYWLMLGADPLLARLPSVIFSTLSVPLLYATGCRLTGRTTSLIAAVFLTVSSFHVEWAQETRMYAMLGLLCLASTYFLVRSLQDGGHLNWTLFSLLTAASLYTQLSAIFYIVAQDLAVFLLLVRSRLPRKVGVPWLSSQLGAALLFVPWLPSMFTQVEVFGDPGHVSTTLRGIEGVFFLLIFGHLPYWRLAPNPATEPRDVLVITTVILSALGTWSLRHKLSGTLLPSLFLLTISSLAIVGYWKALVLPKTVIGATFACFLLMAEGLTVWKRKSIIIAGVALFFSLSSLGLAKYYIMDSREDWKEATEYLSRWLQPGEVVFVDCSAGLMPLNYYLNKIGTEIEHYGVPFRHWAVSPPPLSEDETARVDEINRERPGVWLMIYRNGFKDLDGQLIHHFAKQYALADARFFNKIRLFQFLPKRDDRGVGDTESIDNPTIPSKSNQISPLNDNPGQIYFGAWVGERVNIPGDLGRFQAAIAKPLAIVHRYSDNPPHLGKRFDSEWANSVRQQGSIPMLSWQPGFGYGTRSLASVAAGERDEYIKQWADQLRDWGHPIFLRMMWEHNSSWFAWKAYQEPQTSEFVMAWRHIVDVFRARGVTNVTFVWSPHVSGYGAADILPTYPGDDYVDWVALDGYPFRNGRGDFVDTFGPDYDLLVTKIPKPIMIAETSLESWSDELKAQWIKDILENQIPTRFPKLRALVWFDEKNTNGTDFSLLQDQGPLSQTAFKEGIASSIYLSNQFGDLEESPIPAPGVWVSPKEERRYEITGHPTPAISRANLIIDASFEEGGLEGERSPVWIVPSWIRSIVRLERGDAVSGEYSMRHFSPRGESYAVFQDVPVTAGATYELSVMVRVEEALKYGKATLEFQPLNQHGGVIETRALSSWSDVTDGWVEVSGSAKMPRGAVKCRVQIRVTSLRGAFRLDDFTMMRSER